MLQEGQNAGVTGLLNLPAAGVKFQGQALAWETDLAAALMDAAGRGDSEWTEQRPLSSNGFISVTCLTNLDGYPVPTKYRGELGTLRLTQTTGVYQEYSVRVRNSKEGKKNKETGLWPITHICQIVSDPTMAGYGGTQTASTNETFSDKFLWLNLLTRVDPDGLDGRCIRPILIWAIGDNDAAEKTKIDTVLAALVAPYAGMKVRAGNFRRLSKNACIIDAEFGYTTFAEDIINAATVLDIDPHGRTSQAVTAVFNGTPSASAGLVVRGLTTKEYNDNKILYTKQHGTRSTIEDLTFGNTKRTHDISALAEEDLMCLSFTTGSPPGDPSPPDGKVITGYFDVPDTSPDSTNLSYRVYILSFTSNEQKLTLARYEFEMDPNGMETVKHSAVVYDSDVEVPPDPDLPDGLKLDAITDLGIPSHPTKQIRVYRWATTDSIDRRVNPKTYFDTDPQGLDSKAAASAINDTPGTPAGLILRSTRVEPIDDNYDQTTVEAGERSTADDKTFPRTKILTDLSALDQETYTAEIVTTGAGYAGPSAPTAGMVVTEWFDVPDTNPGASNKSVRVYAWSLTTNAQKITLPRYELATDPNDLQTTKRSAVIWDSAGDAPSDPPLPSGLKLVSKPDVGIASHPTKRVRLYHYAKRDTADDLIHGNTYARATWDEGQQNQTASLVTSAASAADLCAAYLATYQNNTTFEGLDVEKLHDNRALVKLRTRDDTVLIEFEMRATGRIYSPARLIGSVVYVYVQSCRKIGLNPGGDPVYAFNIVPQAYAGARMFFTVTRRVTGGTIPLNLAFVGAANGGGPFLGLPANTVAYIGATGRARVNGAGFAQGVSQITYKFFYDSLGHYDLNDCSEGRFVSTPGSSATSPGLLGNARGAWVRAIDFGFSPALLPSADFTGSYT